MAGEDAPDKGNDGVRRAKSWLEFTTRVDKSWTHRDGVLSELLEFAWPHGKQMPFTFDLGGSFRGDELDGKSFVAEVKNYKKELDLAALFRGFLAKCYVALGSHPKRCDNFLWISWSPFQAQKWDQHTTAVAMKNGLLHGANRERVFGTEELSEAERNINPDQLAEAASRIWLITLSDQQEKLVVTKDHYGKIGELILRGGAEA